MEEADVNIDPGKSQSKVYKFHPSTTAVVIEPIEVETDLETALSVQEGKLVIKKVPGSDSAKAIEVRAQPEAVTAKIQEASAQAKIEKVNLEIKNNLPVYNVDIKQPVKLLGFIPIKAKIKVKVDAQKNQVISTKKPWWSFLASGIININF